jgi:hypothetical protein
MNLAMKTNTIGNIYSRMFTTSILKVERNIYIYIYIYMQRNSYIFKHLKSTFQLPKIKGPIQVFASALEKYNYINLGFETNANNSFF